MVKIILFGYSWKSYSVQTYQDDVWHKEKSWASENIWVCLLGEGVCSCALFVSSLTGVDFPFVSVKLKVAEGGRELLLP